MGPSLFMYFQGLDHFISETFSLVKYGPLIFHVLHGLKEEPLIFLKFFLWLNDVNGEALMVHLGLAVKITR